MKVHRIEKYKIFFANYDRLLCKPFNQATKDDLEKVIVQVKNSSWLESTQKDFLRLLRR